MLPVTKSFENVYEHVTNYFENLKSRNERKKHSLRFPCTHILPIINVIAYCFNNNLYISTGKIYRKQIMYYIGQGLFLSLKQNLQTNTDSVLTKRMSLKNRE